MHYETLYDHHTLISILPHCTDQNMPDHIGKYIFLERTELPPLFVKVLVWVWHVRMCNLSLVRPEMYVIYSMGLYWKRNVCNLFLG